MTARRLGIPSCLRLAPASSTCSLRLAPADARRRRGRLLALSLEVSARPIIPSLARWNQLATGFEEPELVKERVCFTPPASEVNEILATPFRLFSIECSSSTGACPNLVQAADIPQCGTSPHPRLLPVRTRPPFVTSLQHHKPSLCESGAKPHLARNFVRHNSCRACVRSPLSPTRSVASDH